MKRKLTAGQTSVSLPIFIQDTSSTTGAGLSGVTEASSGLVIEYRRQGQSSWTTGTPVAKTLGTFTAWGIVADGALAGAYEVDLPDAAFAVGARWVVIRIRGVANMLPCLIEIELDAFNYQDSIRGGLTALPNNTNLANAYSAFEVGTAQAGGASTITLRSGASASNDFYKDQVVFITTGTGAGQTNRITGYIGATKAATVATAWVTQPDNTSTYLVLGRVG